VASAERAKQVALVLAAQEAEQRAIGVKVEAEAARLAAESRAAAIRTLAKANLENYEVEAAGKQAINQAVNTLSEAQINLQAKLALIQALPKIIEESVRPMEKIDSIRIMQVDGLKAGGGAGFTGGASDGGGNLAEQAVGAALRYRAYAPVLDKLLQEVGLAEHGITGLLGAAQPSVTAEAANAGKADGHAAGPAPAPRPPEPAGKAR
jgi:uncharacterized membrane protein YqiK